MIYGNLRNLNNLKRYDQLMFCIWDCYQSLGFLKILSLHDATSSAALIKCHRWAEVRTSTCIVEARSKPIHNERNPWGPSTVPIEKTWCVTAERSALSRSHAFPHPYLGSFFFPSSTCIIPIAQNNPCFISPVISFFSSFKLCNTNSGKVLRKSKSMQFRATQSYGPKCHSESYE